MKLTATLLSVILISVASIFPNRNVYSQTHNHTIQEPFQNIINGQDNPALIADKVAYDVFLRSFVFRPEESSYAAGWRRALVSEMQVSDADVHTLEEVATEYNQFVNPLDWQTGIIKDKHLPNLTAQDASDLIALQKRKEGLIAATVAALPARLDQRLVNKLQSYIEGHVKPRVRSFQPQTLPHLSQHGQARFLSASFMPAQTYNSVGMNGYGHLYIDNWRDTTSNSACGRGLVTEDYNNYGHTWSVEARVYNPEGTRSQSNLVEYYRATTSSTVGLSIFDDFGDFNFEIVLRERCPYIFGLIALGIFLGNNLFVPPHPEVIFLRAFFQAGNDPEAPETSAFASSSFGDGISTTLNVKTTLGPDTCNGSEAFIVQATFRLPDFSAGACGGNSICRVGVGRNANFEISANPVTGFTSQFYLDRNLVAVRLKKRAGVTGPVTGPVLITVSGHFQSGAPYTGGGIVRLVCQ